MQTQTLDAVYEHGVLRPLEDLELNEGEKVRLTIESTGPATQPDPLALLLNVYEGLSEDEIQEIEKHFRRPMSMFELDEDGSN